MTYSGKGSRFSYGAKELNPENGYFKMGARLYDPAIGRFLSRDPLAELFPNHSSYSYAFNSPLNFNDPTGLAPEPEKGDKLQGGVDYIDLLRGQEAMEAMLSANLSYYEHGDWEYDKLFPDEDESSRTGGKGSGGGTRRNKSIANQAETNDDDILRTPSSGIEGDSPPATNTGTKVSPILQAQMDRASAAMEKRSNAGRQYVAGVSDRLSGGPGGGGGGTAAPGSGVLLPEHQVNSGFERGMSLYNDVNDFYGGGVSGFEYKETLTDAGMVTSTLSFVVGRIAVMMQWGVDIGVGAAGLDKGTAKFLGGVKGGGTKLGVLGILFTGLDGLVLSDSWQASHTFDIGTGGTLIGISYLSGPVGWIIGGTFTIGNLIHYQQTGLTLSEFLIDQRESDFPNIFYNIDFNSKSGIDMSPWNIMGK